MLSNLVAITDAAATALFVCLPIAGLVIGAVAGLFLYKAITRKKIGNSKKEAEIAGFLNFPYTILLYEAPHRINETLTSLYKILGNRKIVIARELTKLYEEFIRSDLKTLCEEKREFKGELVLVLEGNSKTNNQEISEEIILKANKLLKLGYSKKDVASILSELFDINKNKLYKELIKN